MPANLGLATNEEMLRELICRFKMEQYTNGSDITVHKAIERALILSEMVGSMDAPEREYRTTDDAPKVQYNNPMKKTPKKRGRLTGEAKKKRDDRIVEMYQNGYAYDQIGHQMHMHPESVRYIVRKSGVPKQVDENA